jgi:hypothetical protein
MKVMKVIIEKECGYDISPPGAVNGMSDEGGEVGMLYYE